MLLEEVAAGKPFVVPGLWMFEVANACWYSCGEKRFSRSSVLARAER
jgi:hypothetical protein